MTEREFAERLLQLWNEAHGTSLDSIGPQLFFEWDGSTKDMLIVLGMEWDGIEERYVIR